MFLNIEIIPNILACTPIAVALALSVSPNQVTARDAGTKRIKHCPSAANPLPTNARTNPFRCRPAIRKYDAMAFSTAATNK